MSLPDDQAAMLCYLAGEQGATPGDLVSRRLHDLEADSVDVPTASVPGFAEAMNSLQQAINAVLHGVHSIGDGVNSIAHGVSLAWGTVNSIAHGVSLAWRTVNSIVHGVSLAWETVNAIADGVSLAWETVHSIGGGVHASVHPALLIFHAKQAALDCFQPKTRHIRQ